MKNRLFIVFWIASIGVVFSQQLDELLQLAVENNPMLSELNINTQIFKEGEDQAKSWNNTTVSTALFISEPETRTGPQRFQLSANQPIPAFGRITARKNYAKSLTDANYQQWVIAKRRLLLEVTQLYYNYQVNLKQLDLIKFHLKRLDRYITFATTKVSTADATVIDVFELKMRKEEFNNKYLQLEASLDQLDAALIALLNSETSIEINEDPNFKVSENEFNHKELDLLLHPELIQYELLFESVSKQRELNTKDGLPGLGLGLNYINVSDRSDINPIDNGKDILAPMLSLSLPIFNKTYKSKERQLVLKQNQIKSQQLNRKNQLQKRLDQAIVQREKALIDFQSQNKNLNLARQSLDIVLSQYQTNAMGIEKLLDIQQLEFNYAFKKIAAIGSYFQGQLQIDYIAKP